ncbi:MAG: 16S rRNA (cytosine(967)-C(5))-methyltransferase RsmB [Lachnospiraceae bacterium]|nr:16S rRNA (cytosine(967)-C(5))-methyltransferase RsmB [Lachnospiraceae bacterium]
MSSRSVALENVISILEDRKPLHLILKESLDKMSDSKDRSFTARLTRGCVERKIFLDHCLNILSSVKVNKQKPVIRNILRCGLYQILFMDSVTDFAGCDESVKLAVKKGFGNLKGFVNGVLRNACRSKDELLKELEKEGTENFSVRYSVPGFIVEDFLLRFGKERTEKIFEYYLKENPISIRCNCSKITPLELFCRLEKTGVENGFKVSLNRYMDSCFVIHTGEAHSVSEPYRFSPDSVKELAGLFVIQDFSSSLVGYVADKANIFYEKNKGKVLDLCAAPGGKSMHMADLGYEVTSCDISEKKLGLIREAAGRCGFDNVEVMQNDASVYRASFENAFDIVLCDVPCSGLGIIGKKPDIKYNMSPEKSKELADLQRKIVKNAIGYLKEDGILIYSTCTLTACENMENAEYFIRSCGLKGIPVKKFLPKGIEPEKEDDCFIQILPGEYGSDGFFICCMGRNK